MIGIIIEELFFFFYIKALSDIEREFETRGGRERGSDSEENSVSLPSLNRNFLIYTVAI